MTECKYDFFSNQPSSSPYKQPVRVGIRKIMGETKVKELWRFNSSYGLWPLALQNNKIIIHINKSIISIFKVYWSNQNYKLILLFHKGNITLNLPTPLRIISIFLTLVWSNIYIQINRWALTLKNNLQNPSTVHIR